MDASAIAAVLEIEGWLPGGDGDVLRTGFRTPSGAFAATVRLTPDRLEVVVGPLLASVPQTERRAALLERLLRLDEGLQLARFALEDDGSVVLVVDWPRSHLDPAEVRDVLDAARYFADRHHAELAELGGGSP